MNSAQITIYMVLEAGIIAIGASVFGIWVAKTLCGTRALTNSVPRRNDMPVYMAFIPLFVWYGGAALSISLIHVIFRDMTDYQNDLVNNAVMCCYAIVAGVSICLIAKIYFARGLKGFGINFKTVPKDLGGAVINLLAVWPVILSIILITRAVGKLVFGPEFELPQHEELVILTDNPQLFTRILTVVAVTIVVPTFEELLFRGIFQSLLRSILNKPWFSIVICSAVFASIHANTTHWPALFALSMCLGYSYEKSGSILRPIFIHAMFNTLSVLALFLQQ